MEIDRQELERLVRDHIDVAYNLARYLLRNDEDAKDAVQDAVEQAWSHAHQLRIDFRPWFLQIVRNRCYRLARREPTETLIEEPVANDRTAERVIDGEAVRQALEALSGEHREILILREMEGLSYEEIGKVIEAPLGTVMSRLSRARVALRELLGETI